MKELLKEARMNLAQQMEELAKKKEALVEEQTKAVATQNYWRKRLRRS